MSNSKVKSGRVLVALALFALALLCVALAFAFLPSSFPARAEKGSEVTLTSEEQQWLQNYGSSMVLAVEKDYPPFVFLDEKQQAQGLAQDYLDLVQKKLGVRFRLQTFSSLNEILAAVRKGEVHIVNAVTKTPSRSEFLKFTEPFIVLPNLIIVRSNEGHGLRESQLSRVRLSLVRSYAVTDYLTKNYPQAQVEFVSNDISAFLNVSFEVSDAAVSDLATVSYWISKKGITNLRAASEVDMQIRLAIGSTLREPLLGSILNKTLASISPEEREMISRKWLGIGSKNLFLTPAVRNSIVLVVLFLMLCTLAILAWNRTLRREVHLRTQSLMQELAERKRIEEELMLAKRDAEEANRAKSMFLATMSHELRTPLNPIMGFADVLHEAPNLTAEQHGWLTLMLERGTDLNNLIGDLLDFSRIEAKKMVLNFELLDVRAMINSIEDSYRPHAEKKGLVLQCEVDSEIPDHIFTDGQRVRQILLNLVSNALKFTPQGKVCIFVEPERTGRLVRTVAEGEIALRFRVQDTGIGVEQNQSRDIFHPFTQGDASHASKFGGVGLGLSISASLVEMLGGQIWFESTPGQGSNFFFTAIVGVTKT